MDTWNNSRSLLSGKTMLKPGKRHTVPTWLRAHGKLKLRCWACASLHGPLDSFTGHVPCYCSGEPTLGAPHCKMGKRCRRAEISARSLEFVYEAPLHAWICAEAFPIRLEFSRKFRCHNSKIRSSHSSCP